MPCVFSDRFDNCANSFWPSQSHNFLEFGREVRIHGCAWWPFIHCKDNGVQDLKLLTGTSSRRLTAAISRESFKLSCQLSHDCTARPKDGRWYEKHTWKMLEITPACTGACQELLRLQTTFRTELCLCTAWCNRDSSERVPAASAPKHVTAASSVMEKPFQIAASGLPSGSNKV